MDPFLIYLFSFRIIKSPVRKPINASLQIAFPPDERAVTAALVRESDTGGRVLS